MVVVSTSQNLAQSDRFGARNWRSIIIGAACVSARFAHENVGRRLLGRTRVVFIRRPHRLFRRL
jgi:hypothetical protein